MTLITSLAEALCHSRSASAEQQQEPHPHSHIHDAAFATGDALSCVFYAPHVKSLVAVVPNIELNIINVYRFFSNVILIFVCYNYCYSMFFLSIFPLICKTNHLLWQFCVAFIFLPPQLQQILIAITMLYSF